nr:MULTISPECIES: hypothetical protein [unclassified Streptomyces]
MSVIQVHVEDHARYALVFGHAQDEKSAGVVGEGGNVLGQFFSAFVVRGVMRPLVVEIFTLSGFGVADESSDAVVVHVVEPSAQQAYEPGQSRHHAQTLLSAHAIRSMRVLCAPHSERGAPGEAATPPRFPNALSRPAMDEAYVGYLRASGLWHLD